VVVDQFFDRTRHRSDTFFGGGSSAHVMFADPVCRGARGLLGRARARLGCTTAAPT
jgi:5'-methylthioadenosine phosphorylase